MLLILEVIRYFQHISLTLNRGQAWADSHNLRHRLIAHQPGEGAKSQRLIYGTLHHLLSLCKVIDLASHRGLGAQHMDDKFPCQFFQLRMIALDNRPPARQLLADMLTKSVNYR